MKSDYGRFSNDISYPKTGKRNNASLALSQTTNSANIKANKPIKAKSEVTTGYGGVYWKDKAKNVALAKLKRQALKTVSKQAIKTM